MDNIEVVNKSYAIADKNEVILKGYVTICRDLNCIIFAHYCESTSFLKEFFKVTKDVFRVNKIANKNLREIKKLIKECGYKKVWTKGVFSIYGDFRPLAVHAGLGKWSESGIIENEKYGTNFLITAIFYK